MASIFLSVIIFSYACMRIIAVAHYKDPIINTYSVLEDRGKMLTPFNLGDYN